MAVRDWDPTPYPEARSGRLVEVERPGEPDTEIDIRAPRARNWGFRQSEQGAGVRNHVVSPRYQGPALIRYVTLDMLWQDGVGVAWPRWQLFVAPVGAVDATGVALLPQPTGYNIFDWGESGDAGIPEDNTNAGVKFGSNNARTSPVAVPLMVAVTDPEFVLLASMISRAAAETTIQGVVNLYEQIDPRDVARFM